MVQLLIKQRRMLLTLLLLNFASTWHFLRNEFTLTLPYLKISILSKKISIAYLLLINNLANGIILNPSLLREIIRAINNKVLRTAII